MSALPSSPARSSGKRSLACSVIASLVTLILSVSFGSPLGAQEQERNRRIEFNIPPQPLNSALLAFSEQARVQVTGFTDDVSETKSAGVVGEHAQDAALAQLLKGTGLQFKVVGKRTYAIVSNVSAAGVGGTNASGSGARAHSALRPNASEKSESRTRTFDDLGIAILGNKLVTGTLFPRAPVGAEIISIDRAEIDRSGFATVQDVIRALPQNFGGGPTEDTSRGLEAATNAAAGTALNLRGLGAGLTLVLINGRCLAPGGSEGTYTDVSNIPLSAIERIDVLPDGASAIYGSEAVGGVVNFILRTDYEGADTQARSGSVTDGSAHENQFAQALGTHWGSGHGLLSYEYYEREPLPAAERDFTGDSDLRHLGGDNFGTRSSNPGNIRIGSRIWAIPLGQDGRSLTPGDFVEGRINLQNRNEGRNILPLQQRHGVFATASQDIGSRATLFIEGLYSEREAQARLIGFLTGLTVPDTNPFYVNPTGGTGPIRVDYNFGDDLGPRIADIDLKTYNTALGATINTSADWRVTAQVAYAFEGLAQRQRNSLNIAALNAALSDPSPDTAFNPFGDGSFNNPVTLAALRADTLFATDSRIRGANITVDGRLLRLGGSEIRLAIGADYRQQEFSSIAQAPGLGIPESKKHFDRQVRAAFAELLVPLIGAANRRAGFDRLEISLAGRYESYSDAGHTINPKLGVEWSPFAGMTLRGTWSRSFKAPNLVDLDESNNGSVILNVPDPLSPSGNSPILLWFGKNADLHEEIGTAWTLGTSITPAAFPGLKLGLTHFHIRLEDRVQDIPSGVTFLEDPLFRDIVIRGPTSAEREAVCSRGAFFGDLDDCRNGPIAAIVDARVANIAMTETTGVDLFGSYEIQSRLGTFTCGLNATYLLDFAEARLRTSPIVNLLDTQHYPVDVRLRNSFAWKYLEFGAAAYINYADSYTDTASEPDRKVGSWTTLDLQLSYDTRAGDQSPMADVLISLNVQNVFDEDPPFLNNSVGVGYDEENADPLGRFISLQVRKRW